MNAYSVVASHHQPFKVAGVSLGITKSRAGKHVPALCGSWYNSRSTTLEPSCVMLRGVLGATTGDFGVGDATAYSSQENEQRKGKNEWIFFIVKV